MVCRSSASSSSREYPSRSAKCWLTRTKRPVLASASATPNAACSNNTLKLLSLSRTTAAAWSRRKRWTISVPYAAVVMG